MPRRSTEQKPNSVGKGNVPLPTAAEARSQDKGDEHAGTKDEGPHPQSPLDEDIRATAVSSAEARPHSSPFGGRRRALFGQAASSAIGSSNTKVEPTPSPDVTQIRPFMCSMISREMYRPRPVPPTP